MRFDSGYWLRALTLFAALAATQTAGAARNERLDSPAAVLAMLHAKVTCSNLFVSGLGAERTAAQDLRGFGDAETVVDNAHHLVTSRIGNTSESALFSPGIGCTAVVGSTPDALRADHAALVARLKKLEYGDVPLVAARDMPGVDYAQLNAALEDAFSESAGDAHRTTRAIIVLYKGRIVAERYAAGVTADTALAGFSMTKSVLSAVLGTLVEHGLLKSVDEPVGLETWRAPGDRRADITYDDLMRMTARLAWNEDYTDPMSDVLVALFGSHDSAALAASRPIYMPSEHYYNYSSGNAQILSVAVRRVLEHAGLDARFYPYEALFAPLGMRSAQLETDAAGNPLYAAFMYASARDWARFGQFLLDDGRVGDRRLLPEGWLRRATAPTSESDGQQGALFAVNDGAYRSWPSLPADTYGALGFRGQRMLVVPSQSLVIVRLGASVPESAWDVEPFAAQVVRAVTGMQTTAADPH